MTGREAVALLDRIAEALPAIDDVSDYVCDHEDELGACVETLRLGLDAGPFAEQLVKAREELLKPRGHKK